MYNLKVYILNGFSYIVFNKNIQIIMKTKIKELLALLTKQKPYLNLGVVKELNKKGVGVYY